MAQKRINMVIQDEIIRLKNLGLSQRKIAKVLGIDWGTVSRCWSGTREDIVTNIPSWVKDLDWKQVNIDINDQVPKKILYEELSELNELPSYQAFCQYIRNNVKEDPKNTVSIRIVRNPGESTEVDYSGDSVEILNPATGEIYRVELFVGALSYSSYFYAEFTLTQKQEDFICSHNHMFTFFGGVTKYIIPDNCKTAVTTPDKYDPLVNRTYHDLCVHYNIAVDPADGYKPKHKPNVEKAVDIVQKDFFPRIRNKTYTSLVELNRDLKIWLCKKNKEIMKDRGQSREYYFEKEKTLLKPLPSNFYEINFFKKAKVHPDCHFQFKRNFYSVPYQFVGKEIDLKFNEQIIHAFCNTNRIATHPVMKGHGHYSTVPEHYPEDKIVDINYHISQSRLKAKEIGPNMSLLIERLIKMDRFPLKSLRKIQGILGLTNKYKFEVLDYAAEMALEFEKMTYRSMINFAKHYKSPISNIDKIAPDRSSQLICLQGGTNEWSGWIIKWIKVFWNERICGLQN